MLQPVVNLLAFPRPEYDERRIAALKRHPGLQWLKLEDGKKVPAIYKPRGTQQRLQPSRSGRILVIYSHGNAEDLSELPTLIEFISECLDADVLAFEYPGYSIADGKPTEQGVYAASAAAYAWAVTPTVAGGGGAEPHQVVPYGRSLGSVAACFIASTAPLPVGGLLLQSPLVSGANAFLGTVTATPFFCIDVFKNYQFITNARCRVAICHGTDDLVVSWWNGRKLHALCGADAFEPLWCEGRGHNDMDTEAVLAWAASFLDSLCNGEIRRDI